MLRKLLATTSILFATSAFADIAPYFGISAASYTGPWRVKNQDASSTNFFSNGASGGIFAGFSGVLEPHMYLAAELFLNGSSTQTRTKPVDSYGSKARIRTTYMTGASFIPGYFITPNFVIFARGGVIATKFEYTKTAADGSKQVNHSTQPGGQVGIGLQYAFTEHVKVRGEYNYIAYQFFNAFNNQVSPQSNQFSLGVLYQV